MPCFTACRVRFIILATDKQIWASRLITYPQLYPVWAEYVLASVKDYQALCCDCFHVALYPFSSVVMAVSVVM